MAKILVVDDSNLSRRMMRTILESAGHQVLEAADGLAALERFSLETPDLVMLDMTMEGMHGLDVLVKIRQIDFQAKVIAASADIQWSTRQMATERGAVAFVSKPLQFKEVLAVVDLALKGGRT